MAELSRRGMLKALAAAGGLVGSGGYLSACSKDGSGGAGSDVTLRVAEAPFSAMPPASEQKADVGARAYAEVLKSWLDRNPGVKLRSVNIDIWNQEAMTTAVAGGTAPAIYSSNALGNWSQPAILSAFKQGLAADVTDLFAESGLEDKLAPYVRPVWEETWQVDGKYFGMPSGFGVSDGMFYRKDLFAEAGVAEPKPDYTWQDVRIMARALTDGRRKGFASPSWGLGVALDSDGWNLLSQLPAPQTNWRWQWDYTWRAEEKWIPVIEDWRGMMFEDKALISDVSYGSWDEVTAAFVRGDVAMHTGNVDQYVSGAENENSYLRLAKELDKPIWDVVGWMTYPLGQYGEFPARRSYVGAYSFSPDLDDEALAKSFDLSVFMIGTGFARQMEIVYDETKDLKRVHSPDTIMPVLTGITDKLPGDPAEAWGQQYVDEVIRAGNRALVPEQSTYLPAEESGPAGDPVDDAMSKWMYEPDPGPIMDALKKLEQTRNTQAESFSSVASEGDFIAGARRYYQAHDDFWKKDAPEFHENVFRGWYERYVLPALGD
ncbi:MAG: ABC transporter substrate-binding protein [Actinopolymorphaceae bacterium]